MNAEQGKNLIDSLSKLSRKWQVHTSVTFQITPQGELHPELNFKREASAVIVKQDLIEEQLKTMIEKPTKE